MSQDELPTAEKIRAELGAKSGEAVWALVEGLDYTGLIAVTEDGFALPKTAAVQLETAAIDTLRAFFPNGGDRDCHAWRSDRGWRLRTTSLDDSLRSIQTRQVLFGRLDESDSDGNGGRWLREPGRGIEIWLPPGGPDIRAKQGAVINISELFGEDHFGNLFIVDSVITGMTAIDLTGDDHTRTDS